MGPRHPRPQRGLITRPGVDEVMASALLAKLDLEAVGEEGKQIAGFLEASRLCEDGQQRQAKLVVDDQPDDTERRAAQRDVAKH